MPTHKGEHVFMHRVIAGAERGQKVDHINRDPLDNRRVNLRLCSQHQNLLNKPGNPEALSPYKGVSWHKYAWVARITLNRKTKWLGYFRSQEEAALAYDEAAREIFGEFALLNFPAKAA